MLCSTTASTTNGGSGELLKFGLRNPVMDLQQINEACQVKPQKPIQKLKELAINEPRKITCAKCVSGKFGTQILIELDDCVVFLPKRVAAALTNQVDALKGRRIVFRGMKKINNHYEQTDFEFLEPS
ncbi:hypothetical protein ABEB36_015287 [Hypothenemus hampei]|uniref:Uncharacterized protein n=1 Tax=Hypothenemus hampei TaxID=57062 RepID=A0ABD1DZQ9_HYPHA